MWAKLAASYFISFTLLDMSTSNICACKIAPMNLAKLGLGSYGPQKYFFFFLSFYMELRPSQTFYGTHQRQIPSNLSIFLAEM